MGTNQSVTRAVRVLRGVGDHPEGVSVRQLAWECDLPRSTVHRLVETLRQDGLIDRSEATGRYVIGSALRTFALSAIFDVDLRSTAQDTMHDLAQRTKETVGLSVRFGDNRAYIAVVDSVYELKAKPPVGRPYPVWAGAPGYALLAPLSEAEITALLDGVAFRSYTPHTPSAKYDILTRVRAAQQDGFASASEELILGVTTIAAPVMNSAGRAEGALSISTPTSRMDEEELRNYGRILMDACAHIKNALSEKPA